MDALTELLDPRHSILEPVLIAWLPQRRWFRAKTKILANVIVEAHAPLGDDGDIPHFCILKTVFTDGTSERYSLPLILVDHAATASLPEAAIIGSIDGGNGRSEKKILCDASWNPAFRMALFELLTGKQKVYWAGGKGVLQGRPTSSAGLLVDNDRASKVLGAEQTNTAFAYPSEAPHGGTFVKLYRRLEEAVNPEPEILRFLREHTTYRHVPRFDASLEWTAEGHIPVTVALMQELVHARSDAWEYTLENLRRSETPTPAFTAWVSRVGQRVAELHSALGSVSSLPDFTPEPLSFADLDHVRTGTRAMLHSAFVALESQKENAEAGLASLMEEVMGGRAHLENLIQTPVLPESAPDFPQAALKIRTHGDLHLGQILVGAASPENVWILDFEGEPGRPLAEARRKQSPLRDAAGMLRSFHYAAHTALRADVQQGRAAKADALAEALCAAFLNGYFGGGRAPSPGLLALLDLFVVEKTVYELHYELNNRPDWMEIPLRGLRTLLAKDRP